MPLSVETSGRLDNWKELLLDLFYLDGSGYLFAISHFLGVYMAKFELDQYLNKFGQKDLLHNLFIILYSFGIFISILNINDTEQWGDRYDISDVSCPGFRLYEYGYYSGWLITRGAFLIMYSLIGYFIKPQGIYSFITKTPIFLGSIILISVDFSWSGNVDFHQNHSYFVLAAALFEYLGFAVWQIGIVGTYIQKYVGTRAYIPINVNHQSARTSSFILSVFGATFYQIMNAPIHPSLTYYVSVCLSFSLVLTLALMYFDVIPQKNTTHALGISRLSGMTWLMLHPVYGFCLYVIGVMFQILLNDIEDDMSHPHSIPRFTLGMFIAGASFCSLMIRGTHKVLWSTGGKITSIIRFLIILAHIIVAIYSLHQKSQSIGAVLGTHLTLCVAYLGVDMFKYRRMAFFLFQSYDTVDKKNQKDDPPSAASKIASDGTIAYVPVERRENWMNILGEIRNLRGNKSPTQISTLEDVQIIDGVPVITVEGRSNTHTKLPLRSSSGNQGAAAAGGGGGAGNGVANGAGETATTSPTTNENVISVKRGLSSGAFPPPQRRGSADAVRILKVMKAQNQNPATEITIPRGKSAIDLRKFENSDEQQISLQRTLTHAQLSGVIGNNKNRTRGNYIEDENGKIRERIIIRRKKSAANKEGLTLPSDLARSPNNFKSTASTTTLSSSSSNRPMTKIFEQQSQPPPTQQQPQSQQQQSAGSVPKNKKIIDQNEKSLPLPARSPPPSSLNPLASYSSPRPETVVEKEHKHEQEQEEEEEDNNVIKLNRTRRDSF